MGNPILSNDRIGLVLGRMLRQEFQSVSNLCITEFSGSPLKLVSEVIRYRQVVFIDSIVTGNLESGTVAIFDKNELLDLAIDFQPHGLNIPEVLTLCKRMGQPLPDTVLLIGIEVGEIQEFGGSISPELDEKLEVIYGNVRDAVNNLLIKE